MIVLFAKSRGNLRVLVGCFFSSQHEIWEHSRTTWKLQIACIRETDWFWIADTVGSVGILKFYFVVIHHPYLICDSEGSPFFFTSPLKSLATKRGCSLSEEHATCIVVQNYIAFITKYLIRITMNAVRMPHVTFLNSFRRYCPQQTASYCRRGSRKYF